MKQGILWALLFSVFALTGCGGEEEAPPKTDKLAENVEKMRDTVQLPGADKNRNGIRDDLEPWLMELSKSRSEEFRVALNAIAIAEQRLVLAENTSNAEGAHSLYNLAASCLFYLEETKQTPSTFDLLNEVRSRMLDNDMRHQRHQQSLGMLHDATMTLHSGSDAWRICQKLGRA